MLYTPCRPWLTAPCPGGQSAPTVGRERATEALSFAITITLFRTAHKAAGSHYTAQTMEAPSFPMAATPPSPSSRLHLHGQLHSLKHNFAILSLSGVSTNDQLIVTKGHCRAGVHAVSLCSASRFCLAAERH